MTMSYAGSTMARSAVLEAVNCAVCGVIFALPQELLTNFRRDPKKTMHCPNGHTNVYRRSLEDALRDEVREAQRERAAAEVQLGVEREAHAKTEKDRRRVLKRIENGVCPHCDRSFENLARHMASQHIEPPAGSLTEIATALYVHKRFGRGDWQRRDGSQPVRCGTQKIPGARAAHRWVDVTCPECRKADGSPFALQS